MSSVTSLNPADKPLDLDRDRLVNLLYQMQLTRAFEETAFDQYSQGKVHGTMHLYVGEEAAAIGAIAALRPGRPDRLHAPRPRSRHRQGTGHPHDDGRAAGQGDRRLPRPRRLDAHGRPEPGQPGRKRRGGRRAAAVGRRRPEHEDEGRRPGRALLLRRRRLERGRLPRERQHGCDLEAAGRLHLREQPVRHVHAGRPRGLG